MLSQNFKGGKEFGRKFQKAYVLCVKSSVWHGYRLISVSVGFLHYLKIHILKLKEKNKVVYAAFYNERYWRGFLDQQKTLPLSLKVATNYKLPEREDDTSKVQVVFLIWVWGFFVFYFTMRKQRKIMKSLWNESFKDLKF